MSDQTRKPGSPAPPPRDPLYAVRKYVNYFLERRGLTTDTAVGRVDAAALAANRLGRGEGREPALFIQGIMPRSGTVYAGELLRRHPALCAYPQGLWEFPALMLSGDVRRLQNSFINGYRLNRDRLPDEAFFPLFGAGLLAYLHQATPAEQRALVKMPSVQYLSHFFAMFPHEHVLVLVRDGRDVVHSTLKTWRELNFVQVSLRWARSARMVAAFHEQMTREERDGYWLARYEDALGEPETFVREACRRFGLEEEAYPYEAIAKIRIIGSSKLEKGNVSWRHLPATESFRPTEYWRKWSTVKKAIFKAIAGRPLMALGYADDMTW